MQRKYIQLKFRTNVFIVELSDTMKNEVFRLTISLSQYAFILTRLKVCYYKYKNLAGITLLVQFLQFSSQISLDFEENCFAKKLFVSILLKCQRLHYFKHIFEMTDIYSQFQSNYLGI